MWIVEKEWKHEGLQCVAGINSTMAHRCGYVGIPKSRPLHGVGYSDGSHALAEIWRQNKHGKIGARGIIPLVCHSNDDCPSPDVVFDVHGSLTYAGGHKAFPVNNEGLWWFGFDCGHDCDEPIPEYASYSLSGVVRSLDYVVTECNRLAEQLSSVKQPKGDE